jgi:predicted NACHT family NTPase
LVDWLVDALNEQYGVPRKIGQAWVEADQILPLLDGLDEVRAEARAACVEAINTFRQEHGLLPLVVCSRVVDYEAVGTRLRLQGALVVQPLTRAQVESYLAQVGRPLAAVREAFG